MKPELDEALARWETGELSRVELIRLFPDEDVAGVLDAVERMRAAADVPTPDAIVAWGSMRDHLPARLDDRRRGRSKAIRLLAAAMIAMLLMGATAYAFVPSVRRAVDDAVNVFIGEADPPFRQADLGSDQDDAPATRPGETRSTANGSEAPGDGEDEQDADDENEQDADGDPDSESEDEGAADDGSGSDEGSGSGSDDGESGDEQESSGEEETADGNSGTGSEEAAGNDQGSPDEGSAVEDSGTGSEE
jgi:hypothetical protein